jgi:hypothetical protein
MRTIKATVPVFVVALSLAVGVKTSFAGAATPTGVASLVVASTDSGSVRKAYWRGRWGWRGPGWGWRRPGWAPGYGWGGPVYGWGGPAYGWGEPVYGWDGGYGWGGGYGGRGGRGNGGNNGR